MMTKTRCFVLTVLVSIAISLLGCFGGGSGSPSVVEKDVTGISATLNRFAAAVQAGNAASSGIFAQTADPTANSTRILYIQDFGKDINDSEDNETWEFFINPADISQPSPDIAFVKASRATAGGTLWLSFALVREQGVWYIETVDVIESGSTSFVAATYYPIVPGSSMKYVVEGDSAPSFYTTTFAQTPGHSADGISFYQIENWNEYLPVSRRNRAQIFDGKNVYVGTNAAGEIWAYSPDVNEGQPYRIMKASYAFGESDVITERLGPSGIETIVTKVTVLDQSKLLTTPLRTYSVVPVLQESAYHYMEQVSTETSIIYFASGVGVVGIDRFGYNSSTPIYTEMLFERFINGIYDRNLPVVSPAMASQDVVRGQSMTSVQFTSTGGTAPISWSVSGLPAGLTLSSTGLLTGLPDSGSPDGSFYFTVIAQDKYGRHGDTQYTVNLVDAPPLTLSTTSDTQDVIIGQALAPVQFTATGGTGTITWSLSGALTGLTISAGGVLSGTPDSGAPAGQYIVTILAADSIGGTGSKEYYINLVTQGDINISSYYPNVPGDELTYAIISNQIISSDTVVTTVLANSQVINGITFYEQKTIYVPGYTVPTFPVGSRLLRGSLRGQTAPPMYRGIDADGNVWQVSADYNNGQPYMVSQAWYNLGDSDSFVQNWTEGTSNYTATTTFIFDSSLTTYVTPLETYSNVIKATYVTELTDGVTVDYLKHIVYAAPGIGVVGYDVFENEADVIPIYQEILLATKIGGVVKTNNPVITSAADLGTLSNGISYSVNLLAAGGTSPYLWELAPNAVLPFGLTFQADGTLSGTPSGSPGVYTFTVAVFDKYYRKYTQIFTLNLQ